jgi:hypothetical protein
MSTTLFDGASPPVPSLAMREEISVVALADVLTELGSVSVMKIDCEGCEYPSLLSLSDSDLRRIGYIMMEFHGDAEPLSAKLKSAGFVVQRHGEMYLFAERASLGRA